jgi:hypothetical protein
MICKRSKVLSNQAVALSKAANLVTRPTLKSMPTPPSDFQLGASAPEFVTAEKQMIVI